jgi:hypothetical protein
MAKAHTKSGTYLITANATSTFTFWWGDDAEPLQYFDVSIHPNPPVFPMIPLVETQREIAVADVTPRQPVLILTLRNPNDFDVEFFANHVRVTDF